MMTEKELFYKLSCFNGMTGISVQAYCHKSKAFISMQNSFFMSCVCVDKLLSEKEKMSAVTSACGLLFGKLAYNSTTDIIIGPVISSGNIANQIDNLLSIMYCSHNVAKSDLISQASQLSVMTVFDFERYMLMLKRSIFLGITLSNTNILNYGAHDKCFSSCASIGLCAKQGAANLTLIELPTNFETVESLEKNCYKNKAFSEDSELSDCIKYITQNLHETLSLEKIANFCGYNPSYLSRKFKQIFNINLSKYIINLRLNKAAEYLKTSNRTLAEISAFLSFSSQSHFQNTFKNFFHMTPLEYRKLDNVQYA